MKAFFKAGLFAGLALSLLNSEVAWTTETPNPPATTAAPSETKDHSLELELKLWDKAIQHDEESDQGLAREIFASEKTAPLALSFGQGVYLTLLAQAAVAIVDPFPLPDVVAIPVILLSPIAVGTAGAAGTYFGLRAFPDYRGARLDLWRSSFLLGAANSLFTAQIVAANDDLYTTDESQMLVPLLIGLSSSATVVAGLGASLVAPLENPATGSAALTAGLTLGALTPMVAAAAGVSFDAVALSWLLAGVVNAGYVGGAALAQWLPVKRKDAWFWTFGAALGGYSAFALAVTNQAPNPAIGWGTTAFGVLAGGSVAVALSRWLFADRSAQGANGVASPVSWGPRLFQERRSQKAIGGLQLQFAF